MALADAIALIASQIEEEAKDIADPKDAGKSYCAMTLKSLARQLRTALAATKGEEKAAPQKQQIAPELQHFIEIEKARVELREHRKRVNIEESHDNYATCLGGKSDGVQAPIADMPDGAKTIIDGEVYQLKSGKLVFVEAKK